MRRLGYRPKVGLDEGLERTAAWYLAHRDDVSANERM
jgi:nucleoside-diphosphate-sugar epimerase